MSPIATADDVQRKLRGESATMGDICTITVDIPDDFDEREALHRLAQLVAVLLSSGMSEREIAKRLMRYHPAMEG